jgi:hypothetical protein
MLCIAAWFVGSLSGAGQDGEAQKAPQATFSNERGAAWYGNTVDGIGG